MIAKDDNGDIFCYLNGSNHITSAPYHGLLKIKNINPLQVDSTFASPEGLSAFNFDQIKIDHSGRIILSGSAIVRIAPDGALDSGFQVYQILNESIFKFVILDDNSILGIKRIVDPLNSSAHFETFKLLENGHLDTSFHALVVGQVSGIWSKNDRIILGGQFNIDGQTTYLVSIDPSGNILGNAGKSLPADILDLSISGDGHIIYLLYGNIIGLIDTLGNTINQFSLSLFPPSSYLDNVYFLQALDDNRILAMGKSVYVVEVDSILSLTHSAINMFGGIFIKAAPLDSLSFLCIGEVSSLGHAYQPSGIAVVKILPTTFEFDTSLKINIFSAGEVHAIEVRGNGKLLVGGNFERINGEVCRNLVQINRDGSLDKSFDYSRNPFYNPIVYGIGAFSNGLFVIGGQYNAAISPSIMNGLSMINQTGHLIKNLFFPYGYFTQTSVPYISIAGDKFYAGTGVALTVNAQTTQELLSYDVAGNASGVPVSSHFTQLYRYNGFFTQADGGLIVFGRGIGYDGSTPASVIRIDSEGRLDPTFKTNLPQNLLVQKVIQLKDGYLVSGNVDNSAASRYEAYASKIYLDGAIDESFMASIDSFIIGSTDIFPFGDDKYLIVGSILKYNGVNTKSQAIIVDQKGNFIEDFEIPVGASQRINTYAIDKSTGDLYLGGNFYRSGKLNGLVRFRNLLSKTTNQKTSKTPFVLSTNPSIVGEEITLTMEESFQNAELTIFETSTGRNIARKKYDGQLSTFKFVSEKPGMCTILLTSGSKRFSTSFFVVQ